MVPIVMRHFQTLKRPLQALALVAILALAVIEMVFLFAPDRMVFDLADAPH